MGILRKKTKRNARDKKPLTTEWRAPLRGYQRLDIADERISEPEHTAVKSLETDKQRTQTEKTEHPKTVGQLLKYSMWEMGISKGETKKRTEEIYEIIIIIENFPKLTSDTKPHRSKKLLKNRG